MPTSVHIPAPLLKALDLHAKRLGVSRNRVIVRAVEHELERDSTWSPGFFAGLTPLAAADAKAVDEMMTAIAKHRSSKGPPRL